MNLVLEHLNQIQNKEGNTEKRDRSLSNRGFELLVKVGVVEENDTLEGKTKKYTTCDSEWIGSINYSFNSDVCYISWVKVDDNFEGEGFGTKIVEECLENMRSKDLDEVYIDCKNKKWSLLLGNLDSKSMTVLGLLNILNN